MYVQSFSDKSKTLLKQIPKNASFFSSVWCDCPGDPHRCPGLPPTHFLERGERSHKVKTGAFSFHVISLFQ